MSATAYGRDIRYRGFRLPDDLADGTAWGVRAGDGGLVLGAPSAELTYTDPHTGIPDRYDLGHWVSPPVPTGFAVHQVVPSWTADTPDGCWLQVELLGLSGDVPLTGWYVMARWAADDAGIRRTSAPGQRAARAEVDTDTLTATGSRMTGWQLRVTLARPSGTDLSPTLRTVGAVASGPMPVAATAADVPDRGARGTVLAVPCFSQRVHAGHYPQWGGGGASWCSPTCVAMVLAYWGASPPPEAYAWVDPADPRPEVDHAARHCFDHAYAGTGNWSFNSAYAGRYGMAAFVTRLRSLAEAACFIRSGVPLVLSAAFRRGDVPGLDYDSAGHLVVLVGFADDGSPVLHDPYATDDADVRRTVDRGRFEAAWQTGSGGIAYVIRPPSVPLPTPPDQPNW